MTEPIVSRDVIIESAQRAAESIKPWSVHQCPYPQGTEAAALWIKTFIAARGGAQSEGA